MKYPSHPAAELFPMMSDEELSELAGKIKANGLNHAITLHDGKVLDGRNRLRACEIAGVKPRFEEWQETGSDPVDWVIDQNLIRRHLDQSQRAAIAAEARKLFYADAREAQRQSAIVPNLGLPSPSPNREADTTKRAAALVGVSTGYVSAASRIKRERSDLFQRVKDGEMTVNAAEKELLPKTDAPKNRRTEINEAAAVRRMHQLFAGLEGYRRGMDDRHLGGALSGASVEDLEHWEHGAEQFARRLREYRNAIREERDARQV